MSRLRDSQPTFLSRWLVLWPVPITLAAMACFLYWRNTRTTPFPFPLAFFISYAFHYLVVYGILAVGLKNWTRALRVIASSLLPILALGVLTVVPGPKVDFFVSFRFPASIYWNLPGIVVMGKLDRIILADPKDYSIWDASSRGLRGRWLDFGMQNDGRVIAIGSVFSPDIFSSDRESIQIYRLSADGEPDGSFASREVPGRGLRMLPTGEILVFSTFSPHPPAVQALVLGPDGELVRSVEADLPREYDPCSVTSVQFEATGRLVFSGRFGSSPLAAITQDGMLDEEFSSGSTPGLWRLAAPARDSKGRFLAVEDRYLPYHSPSHPGIRAFGPDGHPDEDLMRAVASYGMGSASAVAVQPEDHFVVAFETKMPNGEHGCVLRRFSSAGQLDSGFEAPVIPWINRLLLLSGGRLLAVRIYDWQSSVNAHRTNPTLVRLHADGSLDAAFNGASELSLANVRLFYTVATGPRDAVILGADLKGDKTYWMAPVILTGNGTVDSRFPPLPATIGLSP